MRACLLDPIGLLVALSLLSVTWVAQAGDAYPDAASTRPLEPGSSLPSTGVTAIDGTKVDLAELTRESGALLIFYRGGW